MLPSERDLSSLNEVNKNTVVITRDEKRDIIGDVTGILNDVESSVSGLGSVVGGLLSDLLGLDVSGVLNTIESELSKDVELVETIVSEVDVGVDASSVTDLVNNVISEVESLEGLVDDLAGDSATGDLVAEVKTYISQILASLKQLL